jgi:integrase
MLKVTFTHNRKKKLNAKGQVLVQMRLYLDRQEKYITTGIYLKPSEWDSKRQRVKSHPLTPKYNKSLADLEQKALNAYFDLKDTATLSRVVQKLKSDDNQDDFLQFVRNIIQSNTTVERSTLRSHELLIKYMETFNKILPFKKITYQYLINFQSFLQKQVSERKKPLSQNYIALLLRIFRGYVTEAIKRGFMNIDPFLSFKIKTVATEKTYLEPHEIKAWEQVELQNKYPNEKVVYDMFLFCCFTGLRISDAQKLKVNELVNTPEGLRLIIKPQKTKKKHMVVNLPLYLLFEGKPEKIIKPYLERAQETIFPTMTQKIYNDWVRKIKKKAGINKHITSHTARHTFGMEMVQKYPIAVVSKMMGHASVATTEVYARMKTATIDNLLRKK